MFTAFERIRPLAALVARLVLGVIMVVHGAQKIFPRGALYQFTQFVAHLGLPYWLGYVAAFTELFGGAFLILGLLVHLAALGVAVDMAVAIIKVHLHHGLTGSGGYEFPLAIFALAVVIMGTGPGYVAADQYVFRGRAVR
jgi:putative oxidoreductase